MAKEIEEVQVPVEGLKLGMFVSRLDRPWLGTSFSLQGFLIDSPDLITELQATCEHVFVDYEQTTDLLDSSHLQLNRFEAPAPPAVITKIEREVEQAKPAKKAKSKSKSNGKLKNSKRRFHDWNPDAESASSDELSSHNSFDYVDETSTEVELRTARVTLEGFRKRISKAFETIKLGGKLRTEDIDDAVTQVVDSLARNPDAMIWLARLGNPADYTYIHCINTSIWAVSLGRRLGMPKEDLELLGRGAIYCDLGKAKLPHELLDRPGPLAPFERMIVQQHIDFGLEILDESGGADPAISNMVAHHHEWHDGSGYPGNLSGDEIDLYARIAAVADCFDAMISHKCYRAGVSISDAVREMYRERGVRFQPELMEEFIQAIGLYPAGTLVELTDDSIGVVVGESRVRRLRPRVMVLLGADKTPLAKQEIVDLLKTEQGSDGKPLHIRHDLEPGAYDLDPAQYFF